MAIIIGLGLSLLVSMALNYVLLEAVCYDDKLEIENAELKSKVMEFLGGDERG